MGGFQPPASIVSVVLVPRAISSEASPTRPECPVIRPSMLADLAAAARRRAIRLDCAVPAQRAGAGGRWVPRVTEERLPDAG